MSDEKTDAIASELARISIADLEKTVRNMKSLQVRLTGSPLHGARSIAVAVTNAETALLWLKSVAL